MKHEYEEEIKCPYCDYEFSDSWEYNNGTGDEQEVECHECGQKFNLYVNYSISYTTTRLSCDNHTYNVSGFIHDKKWSLGGWVPADLQYVKHEECSKCGHEKFTTVQKEEYDKILNKE